MLILMHILPLQWKHVYQDGSLFTYENKTNGRLDEPRGLNAAVMLGGGVFAGFGF
jgi:hypothetical protein